MRDHDTVAYLDVLHAVTDGQYFPSSLVPDNARKLRLDRVEPAGYEQVAIIDGCVLNANQDLTSLGSPGSAISAVTSTGGPNSLLDPNLKLSRSILAERSSVALPLFAIFSYCSACNRNCLR